MVLMDLNEWLSNANAFIVLITGLITLIGTGVGAFFAIRNWFKVVKQKKASEIWDMIMSIADGAMKEAEKLAKEGLLDKGKKKEYAIGIVKASCKSAGIDLDTFIDQLMKYVDDCIAWHNGMSGKEVK